ncbi:sorbitol dehydrogenase [Diplocarpon rosae]|nr:sorbitol dehydrogenase [Diplocarpon rosae]
MPENLAYNFKQASGPGTMRALRFHGRQDIRLDQIPIPVCGKGQVKVKPAFVGICGTDLHEYLGGANLIPSAHPHPITGEKVPLTLGHEFSGTVVEVGEGVTSHRVGDRVCVQPIIFDGTCGACVDGARGTLVNVAIWEKPTPIFPNNLVFKERRYMGVATFVAGDFAEVLDAIVSGAIKPANMITKKVKLADTVSEGFNTLINDKDNHVKVLVEID